jgi:methylmalonyl-CoA mutase, C-terminal domain
VANKGKSQSKNGKVKAKPKAKVKIEGKLGGPGRAAGAKGDASAGASNRRRILIAKPGLDGHDRGAKIIARALRDAGHEVIYTGLHQTPQMIAAAAIQEDAAVIGLSILSGAHLHLVEATIKELDRAKMKARVFVGGIIPEDDIKKLKKMGVAGVFTPGTPLAEVVKAFES